VFWKSAKCRITANWRLRVSSSSHFMLSTVPFPATSTAFWRIATGTSKLGSCFMLLINVVLIFSNIGLLVSWCHQYRSNGSLGYLYVKKEEKDQINKIINQYYY
jgi:hypothetical protein